MARTRATQSFFDDIRKFKFQDDKEYRRLAALAQQGDTKAEEEVVKGNLRFAAHIASKYAFNYSCEVDDLIQEANLGLLEAIRKYPVGKDVPFYIVAQRYIKSTIEKYMMQYYWQAPLTAAHMKIYKYIRDNAFKVDVEEVADLFGVTVSLVRQVYRVQHVLSLNEVKFGDGESEVEYANLLADEDYNIHAELDEEETIACASSVLELLPKKDQDILKDYYGIGCHPETKATLAVKYNMTAENVRRRIQASIKKLQDNNNVKKSIEEVLQG